MTSMSDGEALAQPALSMLREMIDDLQAKKAKEMEPWLERRQRARDERERRAYSETLHRIERSYDEPLEALTKQAAKIISILPKPPIFISEQAGLHHAARMEDAGYSQDAYGQWTAHKMQSR